MKKIITTEDGSMTMYSSEYDDHYHSVKGALDESMHIFIKNGLHRVSCKFSNLNILEVGFGTGLNALCTFAEAQKLQLKINYFGIEPLPISIHEAAQLQYDTLFEGIDLQNVYMNMHLQEYNTPCYLHDNFVLNLMKAKIEDIDLQPSVFHLVYFDPFKPDSNPQVWTSEVFNKIFHALKPGGLLLTYSSKGIVRRAMKEAGFSVEKIPGPCGKREISLATKDIPYEMESHYLCKGIHNDRE